MWSMWKRPVAVLGFGLLLGVTGRAEDHLVSLEELERKAVAASESRRADRGFLEQFLASKPAADALRRAKLDRAQVIRAVAALGEEEIADLAARARKAQNDFAAGALTNQQLTYIVIALGTAVLILVILAA